MRTIAAFVLLALPVSVRADATDAVVMIPSHGASGTVIYTQAGYTLILTCGHAFESAQDRQKRIVLDVPVPQERRVGRSIPITPRLIAYDVKSDLALIELADGPLPYVCPVAGGQNQIRANLWSVGFDEMRKPPTKKGPIHTIKNILSDQDPTILVTMEPPWHGRSGGGLIDMDTGELVGVVSAYVNPQRGPGIYASRQAILPFLAKHGKSCAVSGSIAEQQQEPMAYAPQYRPQQFQQQPIQEFRPQYQQRQPQYQQPQYQQPIRQVQPPPGGG